MVRIREYYIIPPVKKYIINVLDDF